MNEVGQREVSRARHFGFEIARDLFLNCRLACHFSTLAFTGDLEFLIEKLPQCLTHAAIGGRKGFLAKAAALGIQMFDQFAQSFFAQMIAAHDSIHLGNSREVAQQLKHGHMLLLLDIAALLDLARHEFQDDGGHVRLRLWKRLGYGWRDYFAQGSHDLIYKVLSWNH